MEKYFIPYKEALELKELGFDELCFGWYDYCHSLTLYQIKNSVLKELNMVKESCSAPLYQQAFEWFRKKHQLGKIIETLQNGCGHRCSIIVYNPYHFIGIDNRFDEYEEAELNCLRKLIEIVKQPKISFDI